MVVLLAGRFHSGRWTGSEEGWWAEIGHLNVKLNSGRQGYNRWLVGPVAGGACDNIFSSSSQSLSIAISEALEHKEIIRLQKKQRMIDEEKCDLSE